MKSRSLLYTNVIQALLYKINHYYQPGDIIPTQSEIAQETGTSLITVKRAISELVKEGYLESVQGKGTIVRKPPIVDKHIGVSSWTDSMANLGEQAETSWITVTKHIPSAEIANVLQLKARQRTIVVDRLRSIGNTPICLMQNEIPLSLVPDMHKKEIDSESLYEWLRKTYDLVPAVAEEEVYARRATMYEQKELKMDDDILLVINRVSFSADGTPIEISELKAPAENYRYRSKQLNTTLETKILNTLIK
ncbi:MAG TPA: GntR family transcriptional regulator [Sphingobacterium sp.]|nr:GntR family transcriptional regulator [Sphingobacterium sp.]